MLTYDEIKRAALELSIPDRVRLIHALVDSLAESPDDGKSFNLRDFRGVGEHARDEDAQEYVNTLRREWDDRP